MAYNKRTITEILNISDFFRRTAAAIQANLKRDPVAQVRILLTLMYVAGALSAVVVRDLFGVPTLLALAAIVILVPLVYMLLGLALEKADRTIKSQRRFVSMVAHELRGPMTVMQLDAELALYETKGAQSSQAIATRTEELMSAIRGDLDGLRQMSNIIKNLSLLTSAEYGPEHPEFATIDLSALLTRLANTIMRQLATERDIGILTENKVPVYVQANESQLEQIITNLLKNAVLYSPRGSTVVASAENGGETATMTIKDNGIGISPDDLPFVFEPFYRARSRDPAIQSEKGSGLGLAIVAALAKRNNAQITIESIVQKGTTVTLLFPAYTQPA